MSSGRATVNGTTHIGHIPNPPGAVVEMPRTQVNGDRHNGCSTGLHVGTWDYASTFGPKTLIVSVNPRDVVSVPKDCGYQKLRTCRYTRQHRHARQRVLGCRTLGPRPTARGT